VTSAREPDEAWSGPLPEHVRDRIVAYASDALAALPAEAVPARLRAVARFAPAKRARLGATHLAAALENDAAFRVRVVAHVREVAPDLVDALEAGHAPDVAEPRDVAAAAWVLAVPGWETYVRRAQDAHSSAIGPAGASAGTEALREQLAKARAQGKADVQEVRAQLEEARGQLASARREIRELTAANRAAQARADGAVAAAEAVTVDARRQVGSAEADARRLRARLTEAETAIEAARRASREGRSADDVRLRLLLDTVLQSAEGLRRELALAPIADGTRPADSVDVGTASSSGTDVRQRALAADDPGLLDQLLALPQVHLVVDGYNVTKSGYGNLPLDGQRTRLLTRLAALAAQTGAEVTVVFDGATVDVPSAPAVPRGVRVIFSPAGTTADTVIRRLVRAEPPGRPVVVVSTDREVADGVRAAGARAVPASGLLRRLDRA
jgi:predicted RNA-binding protein with PIN domain